jgi:hypothetical protein
MKSQNTTMKLSSRADVRQSRRSAKTAPSAESPSGIHPKPHVSVQR